MAGKNNEERGHERNAELSVDFVGFQEEISIFLAMDPRHDDAPLSPLYLHDNTSHNPMTKDLLCLLDECLEMIIGKMASSTNHSRLLSVCESPILLLPWTQALELLTLTRMGVHCMLS